MRSIHLHASRAGLALAFFAAILAFQPGRVTMAQDEDVSYRGKVNAPEFKEGLEWLNTDHPITMFELRGKVVLIDFWTYCCVNCHHVLPDLAKLEEKYKDELVVIGVHSGKFSAERVSDNIRQAILKHGIKHPVVNDERMEIFREYGARAWPTVVLIDPAGKIVGYKSGEGIYEPFDAAIAAVIKEFDASGEIDRRPVHFNLEARERGALAFPGKVLADAASNQLFVADSSHNRIVVARLSDGMVKAVVGSGQPGATDGPYGSASFDHPQGMAFDGRYLFVADTENHLIRRVDLHDESVATIAGNGRQADASSHGNGTAASLNSPWALEIHGGQLFIAMAGPHQIWVMDLASGEVGPYAGSGREGIDDGGLMEATMAQPSGMTFAGDRFYIADSESSSIRSITLPPNGRVETIVGVGLFDFGDVDGRADEVRLQHPLDVTYYDGYLYVADTYNNKIKRIDPRNRECRAFLGTGEPGLRDGGRPRFDEPGGLSVADGHLYVADTNNHAIRVVDLATRRVSTFELVGLDGPGPVGGE